MLMWRWKHLIPQSEVRDEIDKLDTSVKRGIFAEWASIKADSLKQSNGLYRDRNEYEIKRARKFPMKSSDLTEYILVQALKFNLARADYRDIFLCPYACHNHRVHNTPWEVKNSGVRFTLYDRHATVSGPREDGNCQVLESEQLEEGDNVLLIRQNNKRYELPAEITDVVVGLVDDVGRVTDTTTERRVNTANSSFIRMDAESAMRLAMVITQRRERQQQRQMRSTRRNQQSCTPAGVPSIGGDRIIDLGGL